MTEVEWEASEDPGALLRLLAGTGGERGRSGMEAEPPEPPLFPVSDRKLRLFACACCRAVWPLLTDPRSRNAVEVAERFADGLATGEELREAALSAPRSAWDEQDDPHVAPIWVGHDIIDGRAWEGILANTGPPAAQARILRDLVNPFRPVTLLETYCGNCGADGEDNCTHEDGTCRCQDCGGSHWVNPRKDWLTPLVLRLAESAYRERPGRRCGRCGGTGGRMHRPGPQQQWVLCPDCHGTGRLDDGTLDPARLQVLADALEEEGCDNADLLAHLRSPGPHWRGCWAVDLILGKE